jgi:ornithine cyclodeaminase/alanine dehydrogenase-like protein (mu-crystallin family)
MPLSLTESDVAATFSMSDALRVLDAAARKIADGSAMNAPRQRVSAGGAMLQVLPAALDGRVGHKTYTIGPRGATFWVTLYAPDGALLAIIEANTLGQIRTGAASGLASRYMARADARSLGMIGTGFQARTQIEAICLARPIEQIRVWGRNPQRLSAFCAELSARLERPVDAAAGARAAVADADIVATMTSSSTPVFAGEWLRPGTHVNAAGSNRPTAAEIDVETVRRSAIVAVEDVAQAKTESGDLLAAVAAGAFRWGDAVRLADIVAGRTAGRTDDTQITLFESLGVGIWDIAAANQVYDACVEQRRGRELPIPG